MEPEYHKRSRTTGPDAVAAPSYIRVMSTPGTRFGLAIRAMAGASARICAFIAGDTLLKPQLGRVPLYIALPCTVLVPVLVIMLVMTPPVGRSAGTLPV